MTATCNCCILKLYTDCYMVHVAEIKGKSVHVCLPIIFRIDQKVDDFSTKNSSSKHVYILEKGVNIKCSSNFHQSFIVKVFFKNDTIKTDFWQLMLQLFQPWQDLYVCMHEQEGAEGSKFLGEQSLVSLHVPCFSFVHFRSHE